MAYPIAYYPWQSGNVDHSLHPDRRSLTHSIHSHNPIHLRCNPLYPPPQSHCATRAHVCLLVWVPAGAFFRSCKVLMPERHDAYSPIGTGTHYVEYDLSSQLNLVTIPPTRHHSSDDSDPGSLSRGQGGSRASQAQVDPVLLRERSYSSRMGTSSEVPTYMGNANLSHHSAIRSTTSPFHDQRRERTRTPDSPDLRAPVSFSFAAHCIGD